MENVVPCEIDELLNKLNNQENRRNVRRRRRLGETKLNAKKKRVESQKRKSNRGKKLQINREIRNREEMRVNE